MIDKIKEILKENGIAHYLIHDTIEESAELFFIGKKLDMQRRKKVHVGEVTVYRDFEKNGTWYRGFADTNLSPSMTKEEMEQKIKNAYFASSFVTNEPFVLYEGSGKREVPILMECDMTAYSLEECASIMTKALFSKDFGSDREPHAYLNSAELFVSKKQIRIVNSNGVDVSYVKYKTSGEFVAQCKMPHDVETYESFSYESLACEELKQKVHDTLMLTKDRAKAQEAPAAGTYDVILSGDYVSDLMSYYINRASAHTIYQKYSSFQIGESVQGDTIMGEKLNAWLLPQEPYSFEGIPMECRSFIVDGILKTIHGNCRYSHYLGIEAVGQYRKMKLQQGTVSFNEMKARKGLHIVNFSDFQMDSFSGHFMGEIRLAYLNDGKTITPVTGGSINGSIFEVQKDFTFSKETQKGSRFEGPLAVYLKNVSVAGN